MEYGCIFKLYRRVDEIWSKQCLDLHIVLSCCSVLCKRNTSNMQTVKLFEFTLDVSAFFVFQELLDLAHRAELCKNAPREKKVIHARCCDWCIRVVAFVESLQLSRAKYESHATLRDAMPIYVGTRFNSLTFIVKLICVIISFCCGPLCGCL